MISTETASTSPPVSKESPRAAVSAFPAKPTIRCRTSWRWVTAVSDRRTSRTSPSPSKPSPSRATGWQFPMNGKRRYCRTADGVRLAYAFGGQGSPLVKTGNWLNHLEYDWESPIWRHFFVGLSREHRLIRYDPRGTGLSDWDVADISLDAWVNDVAAVVDAAAVDRFPLLGYSQGCAVSVAYAVRYPERVSHLILYGGFALGALNRTAEDRERRRATITLMRLEWGADNPSIRQMFAARMMPDATREQVESFS